MLQSNTTPNVLESTLVSTHYLQLDPQYEIEIYHVKHPGIKAVLVIDEYDWEETERGRKKCCYPFSDGEQRTRITLNEFDSYVGERGHKWKSFFMCKDHNNQEKRLIEYLETIYPMPHRQIEKTSKGRKRKKQKTVSSDTQLRDQTGSNDAQSAFAPIIPLPRRIAPPVMVSDVIMEDFTRMKMETQGMKENVINKEDMLKNLGISFILLSQTEELKEMKTELETKSSSFKKHQDILRMTADAGADAGAVEAMQNSASKIGKDIQLLQSKMKTLQKNLDRELTSLQETPVDVLMEALSLGGAMETLSNEQQEEMNGAKSDLVRAKVVLEVSKQKLNLLVDALKEKMRSEIKERQDMLRVLEQDEN